MINDRQFWILSIARERVLMASSQPVEQLEKSRTNVLSRTVVQRTTRFRWCTLLAAVSVVSLLVADSGRCGEIELQNGMVIQGKRPLALQSIDGTARPSAGELAVHPILMIDTGMQRFYAPRRTTKIINSDALLPAVDTFKLPHQIRGRQKMVKMVHRLADVTQFDDRGRRRVTINTPRGPMHVLQGIKEITPRQLKVEGLNIQWEFALATNSVPDSVLDAMIRQATNEHSLDDRRAITRFYIEAEKYSLAQAELDAIAKQFPDFRDRAEEIQLQLRQQLALHLINEIQLRRRAGQHLLAYAATKRFPDVDLSSAVHDEVRQISDEYVQAGQQIERTKLLLGDLQASIDNEDQVAALAPMRSEVRAELNFESLSRLQAFLQLESDESLSAEEKLALAYSGWVLGSANATTDLRTAIRLWEARFLLMQVLRNDYPDERLDLLDQLQQLESIQAATIMQLIEYLPPIIEHPGLSPGVPIRIQVSNRDSELPVAYWVLLPNEYTSHHRYPMIVALRPAEQTAEDELIWWGGTPERPGQSTRRGYIVIAPEYVEETAREYTHSSTSHAIVRECLRDARKRFSVDSDRVFLSGHGMGGDAAFDMGMTHPDWFAGIIPITGISKQYCMFYWENAQYVSWYAIGGELDRDTIHANARDLNRMLRHNYDVVFAEYKGRGYESYYSEIHRLFDWMESRRRNKFPQEFEMRVLRPADNEFFWLQLDGMPANVTRAVLPASGRPSRVRPMTVVGRVNQANTVQLTSGAATNMVWLSREFVDFNERIKVTLNGRQRFNDFLTDDLQVMLEDLRVRGDRQKLYSAMLILD